MQNEVDRNDQFLKANLDIDLRLIEVKSDPYVNARMRTAMDLNESEIDLNECEHFLRANLDQSEIQVGSILVQMAANSRV